MEDVKKMARPYVNMALEAYAQYEPIAVAQYGIVRTQMEKVLSEWQKTTEGKYAELQVQYPSLPSSVPFHIIFSPETVIGVVGVFASFLLCRCLCRSCCCGVSRNNKSTTNKSSAAGKNKNKKKIGTTTSTSSTHTGTTTNGAGAAQPAIKHNTSSTNGVVSTPTPTATSIASASVVSNSGEPDVTNTTVKQLLKIKRAELQELQAIKAAKENKQYNKRERKQAQKLEDLIAQLANCATNKQGFAVHPEQFLKKDDDEEDHQHHQTNGKKKNSGKNGKQTSDDDDTPAQGGQSSNKGSEANMIDIQNKLGISMEQATAAAIAMSLHAEIAPEGADDGFTSIGGKKKKKAGPGGLSRQEMKDGWEVVSKKK